MTEDNNEIVFMVESGFGARERVPYVQVLIEAADFMTQMPPSKARELAANLLEVAEAAEADAFLVGFVSDIVGVEDVNAQAGILMQFREYRDAQRSKGGDAQREE